jgi:hypothetical protein
MKTVLSKKNKDRSRLSNRICNNKSRLRYRANNRGQMAIFVALIFQVLFLFFAMTINIGLVVHDKINLQNAVDISSYYVAQKQTEMMNVIAHSNYQIRQAWKLLNWRYYVLGSMGRESSPALGGDRSDILDPGAQFPTVCVTYNPTWVGMVGTGDTVCKKTNFSAPNLRIPPVIAPFLPINMIFNQMATEFQDRIAKTCNSYSGLNWWFTSVMYISYMLDQANRKEIIRSMARNLARPMKEMVDLNGDSIFEGAEKTFRKNLTRTNRESIQNFEILNPLQGLEPRQWLNEIDVFFKLRYSETRGSSDSCTTFINDLWDLPQSGDWQNKLAQVLGPDNVQNLISYVNFARPTSIPVGDARKVSVGVEKNPWVLVYNGVKASTRPRQVFMPFGDAGTFTAKAYSQPFGGRVGPWYGKFWPKGAASSEGDLVQASPIKLLAGGLLNSDLPENGVPKFSRFPGDQLGYTSRLAQSAFKDQMNPASSARIVARHVEYAGVLSDFKAGAPNDVLPYSPDNTTTIRDFEIASVVPDLFDVTYYSIEPNYAAIYLSRLRQNKTALKIPDNVFPRGDIGSRDPELTYFSVKDQIQRTKQSHQAKVNIIEPDVFWLIRNREHLLTNWVHNGLFGDYNAFPEKHFGKCAKFDDGFKIKVPGTCLSQGGRSGYSVKVVSGDFLRAELPLGGEGQGAAKIVNPPPDNW